MTHSVRSNPELVARTVTLSLVMGLLSLLAGGRNCDATTCPSNTCEDQCGEPGEVVFYEAAAVNRTVS